MLEEYHIYMKIHSQSPLFKMYLKSSILVILVLTYNIYEILSLIFTHLNIVIKEMSLNSNLHSKLKYAMYTF